MAFNYILQSLSLNVIEKLLGAMTSFGEKQLLPGGEMHGEVARLHKNLAEIKDFFTKIENEGSGIDQNESFQTWLWQFRDAVEEAEDVLDELEYNEFEKKEDVLDELEYNEFEKKVGSDDDKVSGTHSGYKRKFTDFIAGPFKEDTLKRLKEAVKELDSVVADMHDFLLLARGMNRGDGKHQEHRKLMKSPETGAILTERKVFGREKEQEQVINWLTKLNTNSLEFTDANLSAFTIVGLGGMGKTTLAQIIYDDERAKEHFDLIMWVHVSNNFDTITITRNILEAAKVFCPLQNLDELQDTLREKLESKRFLLILDDVWNDSESSEWDKLIKPLKFGQKGSKILVTSRMQSVADMVSQQSEQTNQEKECLKLDGLEESDYILLFNRHAFAGVDPEKHKDLQLIGSEIAKKLGGCPLTAKVMGGQLNCYMDEYYWEKILKEDIINVDQGENGIMAILKLSYNHLPTCLQLCFRYCAIFPENYVFERDELVYMWLNSGLIQNGNEKPEEVGRDYFSHLLKRSFFEFKMSYDHSSAQIGDHKPVNIFGKQYTEHLLKNSSFYFKDAYYDPASYYFMHDLLRDVARSVSLEECRSVQVNDFQYLPKTLRHIYVFTEVRNDSLLSEILRLRHLRSLIIVLKGSDPQQNKNHVQMLSGILKGLKSLRLLSITANFSCKLPTEVGNLIHLRHLSVRQITADSKLHWFPETVCKLYNLRVMSLLGESDNDYVEINANGISNLTNLRQLRIPDTIMIKIPHIGKLRTLQGSVVFDVRKESGYTMGELKNMAGISSLSIGGLENVRNKKEANMAKLVEKKKLRSLSFFWSVDSSRSSKSDEQLIDNLKPCSKLVDLAIEGYNGIRSPCWMADISLFNLTSISLINCMKWEYLPGLGKLPNLKVLKLYRLWAVEKIDGTLYGKEDGVSFPSLKELRFDDMLRWELWIGLNYGLPFPQLDTLTVEKCPKLREFPPLPPSTNRLHINDVGLVSLSVLYRVSSFSKDAASSLSLVLSKSLVRQQKEEFSLEVLSIKRCENLVHLPSEGFRKLKFLESLSIGKCPNLEACGGDTLLPSSLKELCIGNCGDLEEPLASSVQSTTFLTRLSLEGCAKITSLPQAEVFSKLTALKWLEIKNCKELVSLGGIDAIASLDNLEIFGCDKLALESLSDSLLSCDVSHEKTVENSLKVTLLNIDNQSILSTEQLRHVSSVQEVEMVQTLAYLPEQLLLHNSATLQRVVISNASSLQFVPLSIASLNQLQVLTICEAPKMELLPNLPISVERVHICGCHPALVQHYNNSIDLVWNVLKENIEVLQEPCGYEPVFLQDLDFESEEEEDEEEEGGDEEEKILW